MHADILGSLEKINKYWRTFTHNGKYMQKDHVIKVLRYGLKSGYKTTEELSDAEVDAVIHGLTVKTHMEIYFENEKLPFRVIAANQEFAICTRKLCRREDAALIRQKVENNSYSTFMEAYKALKTDPVYTIIDFKKKIRGPHNMIFELYAFQRKSSVNLLLNELKKGNVTISQRNFVAYKPDIKRTLKPNQ